MMRPAQAEALGAGDRHEFFAGSPPRRVGLNPLPHNPARPDQSKFKHRNSKIPTAFTLLEVLLVLALISLLASLLIGGSTALLSQKTPSNDELFWKVVQEARKMALESSREVHLRFEPKENAFILDDGVAPRSFPISTAAGNDVGVDFLSTQKTGGTILLGGTLVETQPLPAGVTFYEDGTCTPFRVQIRGGGGAHILAIDPWTCAAVLPSEKVQ
jgi:prepilin-type N-terminal cleavage/methylation domain-containing protein